jgi:hypothetical protein
VCYKRGSSRYAVRVRGIVKHVMGLGSLALGVAGIVRPSLFQRLCNATEDEARELGVRDLCVGVAIYASPRVGLAQRALADVGDAVVFGRRKRVVRVVAVLSALVAAVAAAS